MGKTSTTKSSASTTRRAKVLRKVPKQQFQFAELLKKPEFLRTCFIVFLFLLLVSLIATWSREQIKVRDGQIVTTTRVTRLDFEIEDSSATETNREEAKNSSPRIYIVNNSFIERLSASILGLPTAVFGKTAIEEVAPELVEQFKLTPEKLVSLQAMSKDGAPTSTWRGAVSRLTRNLRGSDPLLTNEQFQIFTITPPANRALVSSNNRAQSPYQAEAIALPVEGSDFDPVVSEFVSRVGFKESTVPIIEARLLFENQPSVQFDVEATQKLVDEAIAAVQPVISAHHKGEIIWTRGDRLTAKQYENAVLEQSQFEISAPIFVQWLPRLGTIGLLAMLAIFIGAYTTISNQRISKNPLRLFMLCFLMVLMLGLSVVITLEAPVFIFAAAIVPTLLVITIACLAYGQRLAMFLAFMQCALVTMALSAPIIWFVVMVTGCGTMIGQLKDVSHRQTLIRASGLTAIVFALGTCFFSLIELPDITVAWQRVVSDSLIAGGSALLVGFFVLGILEPIEKIFDITTGMSLTELKDTRNNLLKKLQELAPGTFNHSRQVADIAESAAEAIGCDSLLTYVGGLYHDIGKMNKPEYFIENQSGFNRHTTLKPSMSLLIIIGHVKDGIELAREYDLPREIIHFIEAHHGSTLVEYFYHAAKKAAEESGGDPINDMNFRYPGPKPKTKEVAILMIADAVESASRVMPDPNPGRIEALVRDLSRKRLLDHQFDDCDLTFGELAKIEDAIIARLNSIYHTRVKYPEEEKPEKLEDEIPKIEEEGDLRG
ncbi:MAG: HDIG domain-containing protein [Planctomycetes bacterium]|nr:HDIG domain-containing protein [Planctomycetota bacterium]